MSDIVGTLTFHSIYRVILGDAVLRWQYSNLDDSQVLVEVFKVSCYHFQVSNGVLTRLVYERVKRSEVNVRSANDFSTYD